VTLRLLHLLFSPLKSMTALLDRIVGVIAGFQSREADLRQRLADALADDAADEAEIAAARSDALAAMERAATAEALMAQLQASADDATSQLSAIDAFIDQFVPKDERVGHTFCIGRGEFAIACKPITIQLKLAAQVFLIC
jgi:hypothetical protein